MRPAVLVLLAGCAGTVSVNGTDLHRPGEWPDDFSAQQSIDYTSRTGNGHFDAVLQKQGDTLTIVGLGPMNARVFSVRQTGSHVEYQHLAGPELPFLPEKMIRDVQRVYFRFDGDHAHERWEGGELREKSFADLHILYGPGCGKTCHPKSVVVENWIKGYTLRIESSDYEALE